MNITIKGAIKTARGRKVRAVHDGSKVLAIIDGSDNTVTSTAHTMVEFNSRDEALSRLDEMNLKRPEEVIPWLQM